MVRVLKIVPLFFLHKKLLFKQEEKLRQFLIGKKTLIE
jgi:hypothetical protein